MFMMVENDPIIGRQLDGVLKFEEVVYNAVLIRSFLRIRALVSLVYPLKISFWMDKSNIDRC